MNNVLKFFDSLLKDFCQTFISKDGLSLLANYQLILQLLCESIIDRTILTICGECRVHIAARSPKAPSGLVVKVGTLDDPSVFEGPKMVFWTQEKKPFHVIPDGAATFTSIPGR